MFTVSADSLSWRKLHQATADLASAPGDAGDENRRLSNRPLYLRRLYGDDVYPDSQDWLEKRLFLGRLFYEEVPNLFRFSKPLEDECASPSRKRRRLIEL